MNADLCGLSSLSADYRVQFNCLQCEGQLSRGVLPIYAQIQGFKSANAQKLLAICPVYKLIILQFARCEKGTDRRVVMRSFKRCQVSKNRGKSHQSNAHPTNSVIWVKTRHLLKSTWKDISFFSFSVIRLPCSCNSITPLLRLIRQKPSPIAGSPVPGVWSENTFSRARHWEVSWKQNLKRAGHRQQLRRATW